jgi:hypothetical protein
MPRKKKPAPPALQPGASSPLRRYPRIPSKQSIVVRKIGGPIQGRLATTESMGLGGCCFAHEEPHPEGQTLYLSILIGHELAQARVRVVYCRDRDVGGYEVGVEFAEVPQRDLDLIRGLISGPAEAAT